MREMQGNRGIFTRIPRNLLERIPGNALILAFRGMFQKIPENLPEDSGECSRSFRGMFKKIPGNVPEDSGERY